MRKALLIGLAAAAVSCIDVPAQPAKDALDVKDVAVTAGVGLETACTPSGPEICFDARDNNCNGVIDEGCGLHTGLLQFVIAWEAAEADVDLNVFDPNDEMAGVSNPTAGGLVKDRDCPRAGECQGQNVENVYLVEGEPRKGKYKVVVHLEKANGAAVPVRVRLGVRMGSRLFGMSMELSPGQGTEDKEFSFELR
ncbi:MAG: MopE-related protein [Minicystis sp.]